MTTTERMQDDRADVIMTLFFSPAWLQVNRAALTLTLDDDDELAAVTVHGATGDQTYIVTGWDVEYAAYRMVDSERLAHPSHAHLRGKRQIVTR